MEDLNCSDITDILDGYTIRYASLHNVKGHVNLSSKIIRLNPLYNQDVETLIHEFAHIYYESFIGISLSEHLIEYESQKYLIDNPSCYGVLENYILNKTERFGYGRE